MKFKSQLTAVAAALACACGVSLAQTTTPGTGGSSMTPSSPSTPPTHPTERTTPSNRLPTNPDGSGGSGTGAADPSGAKSGSQAEAMQACKNLSGTQERKDCMDKANAMKPSGEVAPAGGGMPTRTEQMPSTGGTKPNPSGTSSGTGSPQK